MTSIPLPNDNTPPTTAHQTTHQTASEDDNGRLGELISLITHPKKRLFLQNYPVFKFKTLTSEAIGIARETEYFWEKKDPVFAEALELLEEIITANRLQNYLDEIDRRALDRTAPMSSICLLACLKAYQPERWRENIQPLRLEANITVIHKIPRPEYDELGPAVEVKELREAPQALSSPVIEGEYTETP